MRKTWSAVFALAFVGGAHAEEKGHHTHHGDTSEWYTTLHQKGSRMSCCNNRDCRPADGWRMAGDHYEFFFKKSKKWCHVPESARLDNQSSPDGEAHVCHEDYIGIDGCPFPVFCFVPGPGT